MGLLASAQPVSAYSYGVAPYLKAISKADAVVAGRVSVVDRQFVEIDVEHLLHGELTQKRVRANMGLQYRLAGAAGKLKTDAIYLTFLLHRDDAFFVMETEGLWLEVPTGTIDAVRRAVQRLSQIAELPAPQQERAMLDAIRSSTPPLRNAAIEYLSFKITCQPVHEGSIDAA